MQGWPDSGASAKTADAESDAVEDHIGEGEGEEDLIIEDDDHDEEVCIYQFSLHKLFSLRRTLLKMMLQWKNLKRWTSKKVFLIKVVHERCVG